MAITTLLYNNLFEGHTTATLEGANALAVRLLEVDDDGTETVQRSRLTMTAVMGSAATVLSSTGYTDNTNLAGVSVDRDETDNIVEISANDVDFGALTQDSSETIVAAIVFLDGVDDDNRVPLWKVTATAGDIVTPNGESFFLRFSGSSGGEGGILWKAGQGTLS